MLWSFYWSSVHIKFDLCYSSMSTLNRLFGELDFDLEFEYRDPLDLFRHYLVFSICLVTSLLACISCVFILSF